MSLAEVENGMAELQDQTEIAVGRLQQESEEKDVEIEAANREIEKLGHQVYMLEEENERVKEASDRLREDEAVERERLDALSAALKDVSSLTYKEVLILTTRESTESGRSQGAARRDAGPHRD